MEGQALDARPLQNFIVAGPHAAIGVLPDPDVLTATPVPVAAVKPLPHTRTVARYALRRFFMSGRYTVCSIQFKCRHFLDKSSPCRLHPRY